MRWPLVALSLCLALTPLAAWGGGEPPPPEPAPATTPAPDSEAAPTADPPPAVDSAPAGEVPTATPKRRFGRRNRPKTVADALEQGYVERPEDQPPGSTLGGLLAMVPGFFIHGVGHYYAGEQETALGLLIAEVAGVAAVIAGALLSTAAEGESLYGAPRQWLLHTGIMLFGTSWLADIIGAFKGSNPLHLDGNQYDRNLMSLNYRYTSDPITQLNHSIMIWYELNLGRLFLRPLIDMEVGLDQRRFWLDAGWRLWRPDSGGEHLALGTRLRREETRIYGFAARGYEGYTDLRLDVGRLAANLKGLYLTHRVGLGTMGYQISSTLDRAPSVLSPVDFSDNYLSLITGMQVYTGRRTRAALTYIQDPTYVLAPVSTTVGVIEAALVHHYDDSLDVLFTMSMGQGYVAWLGVVFR